MARTRRSSSSTSSAAESRAPGRIAEPTVRRREPAERASQRKRPHDIDLMLRRIREAVKDYPKAALFELYEEGHKSTFEILAACIVSIRTFDEVTVTTARKLFALGTTPRQIAKRSVKEIDDAIRSCTFHEPKAKQIHDIAVEAAEKHGNDLPCSFETLTSFRGVGPKCANLVLGIACGKEVEGLGIGVDIHVHRVTNRWGYVEATTPEKTMAALHDTLPRKYWIEINALLVPFGKHICTGKAPKCSGCPVLEYCRQVGVTEHR
jgi:endonuclease III